MFLFGRIKSLEKQVSVLISAHNNLNNRLSRLEIRGEQPDIECSKCGIIITKLNSSMVDDKFLCARCRQEVSSGE